MTHPAHQIPTRASRASSPGARERLAGALQPSQAFHPRLTEVPHEAREIPLTRGLVALVDAADFEWLSQWRWCVCVGPHGHLYARRNATVAERASGRPSSIYMHREVGASADAPCVDHINRQTLDNRRANLRPATYSQNSANSSVPPGACPYRGVTFDGRRIKRPYRALIRDGVRNLSLGSFADPQDAARAYDAAALRLFGAFAALNFPEAQ